MKEFRCCRWNPSGQGLFPCGEGSPTLAAGSKGLVSPREGGSPLAIKVLRGAWQTFLE